MGYITKTELAVLSGFFWGLAIMSVFFLIANHDGNWLFLLIPCMILTILFFIRYMEEN
jgi:hypothetical protein